MTKPERQCTPDELAACVVGWLSSLACRRSDGPTPTASGRGLAEWSEAEVARRRDGRPDRPRPGDGSQASSTQARHDLARPRVLHRRPARPAAGAQGAGGPRRLTEPDVLRSALAAVTRRPWSSLAADPVSPRPSRPADGAPTSSSRRLSAPAPVASTSTARAAGLSRGAYLDRLIDGAPVSPADRAAGVRARSTRPPSEAGPPQSRHQPS